MNISVCIGSSCHIKGSRQIVERLQGLIEENGLGDKIELCGEFCMGKCREGVCVRVEDEIFSLDPQNVNDFFENKVKSRL